MSEEFDAFVSAREPRSILFAEALATLLALMGQWVRVTVWLPPDYPGEERTVAMVVSGVMTIGRLPSTTFELSGRVTDEDTLAFELWSNGVIGSFMVSGRDFVGLELDLPSGPATFVSYRGGLLLSVEAVVREADGER